MAARRSGRGGGGKRRRQGAVRACQGSISWFVCQGANSWFVCLGAAALNMPSCAEGHAGGSGHRASSRTLVPHASYIPSSVIGGRRVTAPWVAGCAAGSGCSCNCVIIIIIIILRRRRRRRRMQRRGAESAKCNKNAVGEAFDVSVTCHSSLSFFLHTSPGSAVRACVAGTSPLAPAQSGSSGLAIWWR